MKIVENKFIPFNGYTAIMLFGIIFVRKGAKLSFRSLRHEEIHKRQMTEMLFIFFYLWYGIEYLIRILIYRNLNDAYRNISFEREAYANDNLIPYRRKPFSWVRYIKKSG